MFKRVSPSSSPQAGVAIGEQAGHLGFWAIWDERANKEEVFRVVVKATSPDAKKVPLPASYTFAPAYDYSFVRSIETTLDLKEFLVGSYRAKQGLVTFDFLLSGGKVITVSYPIADVVKAMRGKGPKAPRSAKAVSGYAVSDPANIAAMKSADLKAYSEKIKKELEEKRQKAEAEAKAKEAEKAAAAAKAAEAAKAKAAAAAAAAAKPAAKAGEPAQATLTGGRVALIYGTSTGNTQGVAEMIKAELGDAIDHMKNVSELAPADFAVPEVLILGVPTWHIGEMQDDWALILPELDKMNFKGKKIAVFGLGDGKGYPDTYVDAMQELWEKFAKTGATLHGLWPTDGYDFKASKALKDGKFLGLVIDVENQDQLSEKRVKGWASQIRAELKL